MLSPKTTDTSSFPVEEAESLPFISVIIPVRNGEGRLETCLASLQNQTYPKDRFEVIVADGRSVDRTVEISKEFGAIVVDNPGLIQATGRNVGIKAAQGNLLAFTDDDCIVPPNWLANAERYLRDDHVGGVGGPTKLPESATDFSRAVFVLFRWASLARYSVHSDVPLASDAPDLPGCNVIYRARAVEEAGLYREKLTTAEDVDLNLRIIDKGYRLEYWPDLLAWHSKRDKPLSFFHQIRWYAIGRVQLGHRHRGAVRPLHTLMAAIAPLALIGFSIAVAAGCAVYAMAVFLVALFSVLLAGLVSSKSLRLAFLCVPVAAIFTVAWSIGYISGVFSPEKSARVKRDIAQSKPLHDKG